MFVSGKNRFRTILVQESIGHIEMRWVLDGVAGVGKMSKLKCANQNDETANHYTSDERDVFP